MTRNKQLLVLVGPFELQETEIKKRSNPLSWGSWNPAYSIVSDGEWCRVVLNDLGHLN